MLRAFVGTLIRRNVRDMEADSPVHERRMLRPLGEAGALRRVPLGCEELLPAALSLLGCLFLWVTLGRLGAHLGRQSNCRTWSRVSKKVWSAWWFGLLCVLFYLKKIKAVKSESSSLMI